MDTARQHLRNVSTNLKTFLRNDFQMKSGMKYLIESFYSSIVDGTPEPISCREILLTANIMESIFTALSGKSADHSLHLGLHSSSLR